MLKTFSGRAPSQNEYELRSFIEYMNQKGVTKYLEVGSRHGDTFYEIMTNLPVGSYGMAIDLPGALWGHKSSVTHLHSVAAELRKKGYVIDVIIGDSTAPKIIQRVKEAGPFDAVLIDGDHSYKGAKKDWVNYRKIGNIVAFHDIVGEGQKERVHGTPVEVPRLWAEIKNSIEDTIEFVQEGSLMGIGVCNLL